MFEGPVQDLIDELGRLPGVGPKSAQRIAFHLLAADPADVSRLQDVLQKVKQGVRFCEVCRNVAAAQRCRYCSDARRDPTLVCVVEEPKDVLAVERTREFKGRYHVLGGALDPLAGVGPDSLRIRELLARLGGTGPAADETDIAEVIIATDPNTEGEATATYLVRLLRDFPGLTVTRSGVRAADGRRSRVRRRADARSGPLRPPRALTPGGREPTRPGRGSGAREPVPGRAGCASRRRCSHVGPALPRNPAPGSGRPAVDDPDDRRQDDQCDQPDGENRTITVTTPVRRIGYWWMLSSSSAFPLAVVSRAGGSPGGCDTRPRPGGGADRGGPGRGRGSDGAVGGGAGVGDARLPPLGGRGRRGELRPPQGSPTQRGYAIAFR